MLKIGCDPEFVLLKDESFIAAYEMLYEDSDFGLDGNTSIGELRPYAADNAFVLVANLRALFKKGINEMSYLKKDNIRFLAGHFKCGKPLGGHIHISSRFLTSHMFNDLYNNLEHVMSILSNIIDNLEEKSERLKTGYGKGWRTANHGGIEYRSPGSWLLNPKIAFVNLFLAEIVAFEFINKNKEIFSEFQENKSSREKAILKFIENSKIDTQLKKIGLKVTENVFNLTPFDWSKDFKEEWL